MEINVENTNSLEKLKLKSTANATLELLCLPKSHR